jgi:hypothetical protein
MPGLARLSVDAAPNRGNSAAVNDLQMSQRLGEKRVHYRFNPGQASSNGQIPISSRQFQSNKTLIAKEMANISIPNAGESRAHGPWGECLQWAENDGIDWEAQPAW